MKLTSSNQKVSVATKDRTVYKVVEKSDDTTFVAPYTKSVYEAGKSYSANLELNQAGDTVKKGLFVLTNKKAVRRHNIIRNTSLTSYLSSSRTIIRRN